MKFEATQKNKQIGQASSVAVFVYLEFSLYGNTGGVGKVRLFVQKSNVDLF